MIELDKTDGLWVVTINRQDKANSVTEAMLQELSEIAEAAVDARGFILTGQGKVFSAGADLEEVRDNALAVSPLWERLSTAIAALPCLSVAALNGTLAGGSMGMALACDLRISVPEANFFYPVLKRGVLPQPSDPMRMAALIGPARTKLILMGGQKISAESAYTFGLIDKIVPGEELMITARDILADSIAADPTIVAGISGMCGQA
ncbi:enoyl-CoA hydratase/isomerase family protein [Phaeobacter sp. 22II1-1F12B]|uniref:enoyl-CoA hydratase/isomerase family protein n=1 Tax=Phaeobacter sp. 22II1-1F12B TaxID=1317111 RepID=UPI000B526B31|nr:enoyl-CoA hydratase/isomerase family protein [Phaeobacter sp. 22II1-1F12B]OWU80946.1 enoyl-CoA hydratase [Phaeobacter sp. 22II1-1F12B]